MASDTGAIFGDVRPLCVELTNVVMDGDKRREKMAVLGPLKALDDQLKKSVCRELNVSVLRVEDCGQWDVISQKLADYIMFPLSELLKSPQLLDTELEHLLSIIRTLVVCCWSNHFDVELLKQLIPLVTFLIGGKPNEFSVSKASNETINNGVDIIRGLLISCQQTTVSNPLKSQEMIPSIGHLISVLLSLALQSQDLDVKLSSLKSLNLIYHLLNDGEVLSLMFPGSVSTFAKIAKSSPHSRVIGEMFVSLTTLTNLVFNDLDLGIIESDTSLEELKDLSIEDLQQDEQTITIPEIKIGQHRTSAWLTTTISQFEKGLKIILNLDENMLQKPCVKDPLFQFNIKMVRNSYMACSKLIPLSIKSLSQLCQYDDSYINQTCESFLYCFHGNEIQVKCLSILNDELDNISFVLSSPNSDRIVDYLNHLNLLLRIIIGAGNESPNIAIESVIENLVLTISNLVKAKALKDLKIKNRKLIEPIETQMLLVSKDYIKGQIDVQDSARVNLFEGVFIRSVELSLCKIMKTIATCEVNKLNLSKEYSDKFESSVHVWLLSEIVANVRPREVEEFLDFGSDEEESAELVEIHYQLLDHSLENLNNDETEFPVLTSLRSINSSLRYFGTSFKDELIDVLYPVVECLASSNDRVRLESQLTITNMSIELYEGSITDMLKDNMDYLIDSISNKLISDSITPKILVILNVLVKIGSMDILKELKDVITALFTLLDLHHGYDSLVGGIFLIFDQIMNQIYVKYDLDLSKFEQVEDDINYQGLWNLKSMSDVQDFVERKAIVPDSLLDFSEDNAEEKLKRDKILEIDSDDESESEDEVKSIPQSTNDDDESDDGEKWLSPIEPMVYSIIVNIFEYGERLMQITNTTNTIIISKLLKRIIPVLATEKRRFMPLSVKIWEKLVFNLSYTENLTVVILSLENMIEIIRYENTFMVSRFIEVFKLIRENKYLNREIISKYSTKRQSSAITNRTSMSRNLNLETFNKLCQLFILAMEKMGRYLPNDVGLSMIKITLPYDDDPTHYGYFDNHVRFMKQYIQRNHL